MRKKVGIIKRVLCLCLIFLLSINSFAAIVSDNDGSAFITKAEFDALKSSFQSQIDSYNQSIDSKIDGAIASYLAGINILKQTQKQIIYNDWNKIHCLNVSPSQNWSFPDYTMFYVWVQEAHDNYSSTGGWRQCSWVEWSGYYKRNSTNYSKRLLCVAGAFDASASVPTTVIWQGRALNYRDTINLIRFDITSKEDTNPTIAPYWVYGSGVGTFYICYLSNIVPGRYANLSSGVSSVWPLRVYTTNSLSTKNIYLTMTGNEATSISTSILTERDNTGVIMDYEHVLAYDNTTYFKLSDSTWTNSLLASGDLIRTNMPTPTSCKGKWSFVEGSKSSSYGDMNYKQFNSNVNYYKAGYGSNTDSSSFPSVGYVGNYASNKIMLTDDLRTTSIDTWSSISVPNTNITQGFPLIAAKAGDKITWEANFCDYIKNGSAVSDGYDLKLYLSMGPFTSGITPSTSLIQCENSSTDYIIVPSTTKKGVCTFVMPSDGIVYCKWCPNGTLTTWDVTLDIANSNNYMYIRSDE